MAEITPVTEEQKFQLDNLDMNQNSAAEEAFAFIGTDELKLELFFQSGSAKLDITACTIGVVHKSKELLDLFTTEAWDEQHR